MLATPVETVSRDHDGIADIARIHEIALELDATEIVVGLPLSLSGARTPSTDDAVRFAEQLAVANRALPIRLIDERLSTVSAQSHLHASGRSTKGSRRVIDQAAAVVILQHALDIERSQGKPPGTTVDEE